MFEYPESKELFVTHGQSDLANKITLQIPQCDHEEADTQLIVHGANALSKGQSTCLVCTVDTDVVVILVGKFYYLTTLNSNATRYLGCFRLKKKLFYWHINTICHKAYGVRKDRWHCLFFHSFTGCDGKRLALEAWNSLSRCIYCI